MILFYVCSTRRLSPSSHQEDLFIFVFPRVKIRMLLNKINRKIVTLRGVDVIVYKGKCQ